MLDLCKAPSSFGYTLVLQHMYMVLLWAPLNSTYNFGHWLAIENNVDFDLMFLNWVLNAKVIGGQTKPFISLWVTTYIILFNHKLQKLKNANERLKLLETQTNNSSKQNPIATNNPHTNRKLLTYFLQAESCNHQEPREDTQKWKRWVSLDLLWSPCVCGWDWKCLWPLLLKLEACELRVS